MKKAIALGLLVIVWYVSGVHSVIAWFVLTTLTGSPTWWCGYGYGTAWYGYGFDTVQCRWWSTFQPLVLPGSVWSNIWPITWSTTWLQNQPIIIRTGTTVWLTPIDGRRRSIQAIDRKLVAPKVEYVQIWCVWEVRSSAPVMMTLTNKKSMSYWYTTRIAVTPGTYTLTRKNSTQWWTFVIKAVNRCKVTPAPRRRLMPYRPALLPYTWVL